MIDTGTPRPRFEHASCGVDDTRHFRHAIRAIDYHGLVTRGAVRALPQARSDRQGKAVVTTAIAREMVGFIWAIARIVQPAFAGRSIAELAVNDKRCAPPATGPR